MCKICFITLLITNRLPSFCKSMKSTIICHIEYREPLNAIIKVSNSGYRLLVYCTQFMLFRKLAVGLLTKHINKHYHHHHHHVIWLSLAPMYVACYLSLHACVSSTTISSANYNGNLGFCTTGITRLLQLVESYFSYPVDWLQTQQNLDWWRISILSEILVVIHKMRLDLTLLLLIRRKFFTCISAAKHHSNLNPKNLSTGKFLLASGNQTFAISFQKTFA